MISPAIVRVGTNVRVKFSEAVPLTSVPRRSSAYPVASAWKLAFPAVSEANR